MMDRRERDDLQDPWSRVGDVDIVLQALGRGFEGDMVCAGDLGDPQSRGASANLGGLERPVLFDEHVGLAGERQERPRVVEVIVHPAVTPVFEGDMFLDGADGLAVGRGQPGHASGVLVESFERDGAALRPGAL